MKEKKIYSYQVADTCDLLKTTKYGTYTGARLH
ncbi:hypothetical protein CYPRO_3058 [Cyclonatronum proteinivorum]|uniref:Uncharacterized protein n=1 Tax=Cyclonatronum proteinivorum TaxID=1457365 RepID=A0A345UP92_9BACT|nr:hypothetical protein CYPRO_3058 [Cyclonatronum proteinivorum]